MEQPLENMAGERSIPAMAPPPDKFKVAGFFILCAGILGAGGTWLWQQQAPQASPETPATTVVATAARKASPSKKTFRYEEPAKPAPVVAPEPPPVKPAPPPEPTPPPAVERPRTTFIPPPPTINRSGALSGTEAQQPATVSQTDILSRALMQNALSPQPGNNTLQPRPQPVAAPAAGLAAQLTGTANPSVRASVVANRDYLLAKGGYIDCVLNTRLNSTVPGMTKCTLTRNVYSDNGTTLLLERGSQVTGEYRANLSQGQQRLFVLWDRVKTPYGVVVDLSSPATDSLGGGGVTGDVETHFWARFGGAMMLSLVDDLAAYASTSGSNNTNNFNNSSQAAQTMATEALKNTINIKPTFSKNQGERVGIFIARDIDFSSVYQLRAKS